MDSYLALQSESLIHIDELVSSENRPSVKKCLVKSFAFAIHSSRANGCPTATADNTACRVTLQQKQNAALRSALYMEKRRHRGLTK